MTSDIVLTEQSVDVVDTDERRGGRLVIRGEKKARVVIEGKRGRLEVDGPGGSVTTRLLRADSVSAKSVSAAQAGAGEVVVGTYRGDGRWDQGVLTVHGAGGILLRVDGGSGAIEVDGHGDLRDRLAEVAQLRAAVADLQRRLQAMEG